MSATTSPHGDLLGLVCLVEFLVRTGQDGAALAATDRLADGLLAHYQELARSAPMEVDGLRRETLRLWADVKLLGSRLRLGPVRRPPALRSRVEALLMAELLGAVPARH
jgi:hypothetical protein